MILAPGLSHEDIDGNGHSDELYLQFEVDSIAVSPVGWSEEIQNKSSPIVRRDCLIVVNNENVSFSAVQHVPPWVASRRPLGTYLHPTIT